MQKPPIMPPFAETNRESESQAISHQLTAHVRPRYIQTGFNPDDGVFEKTERIVPDYSLPAGIKEDVRNSRQTDVETFPPLEAGKDKYETAFIHTEFKEKTQKAQKSGKSWKLEYIWDEELNQAVLRESSVIMGEVKRSSLIDIVDSLRWSRHFDRAVGHLRNNTIDISPQALLDRAANRKGVTAAQREDLYEFVNLFQLFTRDPDQGSVALQEYFSSYYVVSSLKLESRFEGEGDERNQKIVKKDANNWRVLCALAIMDGMDETRAFAYFAIPGSKEDGEESSQDKVKKIVTAMQQRKNADPSADLLEVVFNENARIVGRIIMYRFMQERAQQLASQSLVNEPNAPREAITKRVLAEAVMLQVLNLVPQDPEAVIITQMLDETLYEMMDKVFPSQPTLAA